MLNLHFHLLGLIALELLILMVSVFLTEYLNKNQGEKLNVNLAKIARILILIILVITILSPVFHHLYGNHTEMMHHDMMNH